MTLTQQPHLTRIIILALTLPLAACFGGSDDDEPGALEQFGQLRDMAEAGGEAAERAQEEAEKPIAEPVDFRKLRDLLPEELAGLARTEIEGEKTQMMGSIGISQATASYAPEEEGADGTLQVEIMDMGSAGSFAMLGMAWLMTEMDKETDSGYERTAEFEGHRGYEKYDRPSERGEVSVIVADRFIVELGGRHIEMDAIKRALNDIDLDALEAMKDEGREEA